MTETVSSMLNNSKSNTSVYDDFSRDVWCLFGFPIDNLTLKSTCHLIDQRMQEGKKCVLSTININWLVTSLHNPDFRSAIINSDICVLDGVPLLWLAQTLGLPNCEVVPGSTLIKAINDQTYNTSQSTIFLFGGNDEIGQKAVAKLKNTPKGLKPVGHLNPGFGSVDDFNKNEIISEINEQSPDILLVALGALKGQLWIEANRDKLNAKLISHLGATINFLAGTVKRAPKWMQKAGIEWMWRIIEEPSLFFRYGYDGTIVLKLVLKQIFHFFSYKTRNRKYKKHHNRNSNILEIIEKKTIVTLFFSEIYNFSSQEIVKDIFSSVALKKKDVIFDFKNVRFVDNSFLGLFLLLLKHQKRYGKDIKLINVNKKIDMLFRMNMIDKTLNALNFNQWETI